MPVRSENPATGATVLEIEAASPREVDEAVARARAAGRRWARIPVAERGEVLRRFADVLDRDADRLAALLVAEVGKLRRDADGEVTWTADTARWYADHPPRDEAVAEARVRRRPLGVIAAVTPWNVPLVTPAWKWLPALMAGNAVVWKPSELATATALATAEAFAEAGLPDDVLAVLPGDAETATTLCRHPDVAGVHFTGSTAAGRAVAALAGPRFARVALEMGGNGPMVVLDDADLDAAADASLTSAFLGAGQSCTAGERFLVHEAVHDAYLEKLLAAVDRVTRLGDPFDPATTLGPLNNEPTAEKMDRHIADALDRGATLVRGGARAEGFPTRLYYEATVLDGVTEEMVVANEETFGPIVPVTTIRDEAEALRIVDSSPYGLLAAVWTRDLARGLRFAESARTGWVNVNASTNHWESHLPFGGRAGTGSGVGRVGGRYPMETFTELKTVIVNL